MNDYETSGQETDGIELDERDRRALTQYLTVLPDAPDLYRVVSQSGKEYVVDTRENRCTCPDHEYRGVRCKHLRRVAFATGERDVPKAVEGVDPQLGEHVETNDARAVATDGGPVAAREPRVEYTHHVEPAEQGGEPYVRCGCCGAECLEKLGGKDGMIHRDGCLAGEGR